MQWEMSLTGDKKLDKTLRDLEPKVRRKTMVAAMREGAKKIEKVAKQYAPVGKPQPGKPEHQPGTLKKSIKVRAAKRSRRTFGVDVRIGDKNWQGDAWYGSAVEFGSKKQEGQHFLERAYDEKGKEVRDFVLKEIRAGIERLASQGGR